MRESDWWIDHAAHMLHHGSLSFPCSRDIEAMAVWENCALLLSSDTDCLSLWDEEGLARIARVGVYPQDMAVSGNAAYICGGADGKLHLLTLPELQETAEYPLPGMPERICLHQNTAYILTLMVEPEVHTALLRVELATGEYALIDSFFGVPEALAADESGLWVAVSEGGWRLPFSDPGT